jgi:hypothetical protein
VSCLIFADEKIVSGGDDYKVCLWNFLTWDLVWEINDHMAKICYIFGSYLTSNSTDRD